MATTNLDQLLGASEVERHFFFKSSVTNRAGLWQSYWASSTGFPIQAATPPSGGEVPDSTSSYTFPMPAPGVGKDRVILLVEASPGVIGSDIAICDRLWHNSGYTGTTVGSPFAIAGGAVDRPDALGDNVEIWLEVYSPCANTASTITVVYTNQDGTAGRTATWSQTGSGDALNTVGYMTRMKLQAGDTGVRSVQSLAIGTSIATGNFGITLLRRLHTISTTAEKVANISDLTEHCLRPIHEDACLFLMYRNNTTTTGYVDGHLLCMEIDE